MSKVEKAIVALVDVFEDYAGIDANKTCMSNAELSTLIKEQLSCASFKDKVHPDHIHAATEGMDKNHDNEVSFKEFSQAMACLAEGYYKKKHCQSGCK